MSTSGPVVAAAAGTHLLADFWGARTIDSVEELDALVRAAVASAGATLLKLAFHQFPASEADALPGGITGYALLAESHISVHTWPERGYVAIDVFMCGGQRPEIALEVMRRALEPTGERVHTVRRGVEEDALSAPGPSAGGSVAAVSTAAVSLSGSPANESPLAVGSE